MGKARKPVAGSDDEPASRAFESVWMGGSSVGPTGDDPMAPWKPRRIPCVPEASLSPPARLHDMAVCRSGRMA